MRLICEMDISNVYFFNLFEIGVQNIPGDSVIQKRSCCSGSMIEKEMSIEKGTW